MGLKEVFKKGGEADSGAAMTEDAALAVISEWKEILGAVDFVPSKKLIRAVISGHLQFEKEDETFQLRLLKPEKLGDGSALLSLTFSEPDGRAIRTAMKGSNAEKDQGEIGFKMLSQVTGQAVGVIERLKKRDIELAFEVISFFD
jgi:hypothetical protein